MSLELYMKVSKLTQHFYFGINYLSGESCTRLGFFEAPEQMFFFS